MLNLHVILLAWRDPSDALRQYDRIRTWRAVPQVTLVHNEGGTLPSLPGLTYIPLAENRGYAGGINAGLQSLPHDPSVVFLLLNNDAQIDECDVRTLIGHLETRPDIGLIGPVLSEGSTASYGGRDPLRYIHTRITQSPSDAAALHEVDYVPGTVLLLRSNLLTSVGVLDEAFFFSGEIADYCRRARGAGWHCAVATDACAQHEAADPEGLRSSLYRYYTLRNRFLMATERYKDWRRAVWFAYWTLLGLCMWSRTCVQNQPAARATLLAIRHGWHKQFGNQNGWFHV